MKATVIVLSSLVIFFWTATPAGAQQGSTPYQGVVTGSSVYVRSGPNMGSYPVAKLSAPARVTVVEKLSDDWLAIQPVRGCYGVISAQYVQPDPTGKIGTITGDGVLVRAAGALRKKDFDNPLGKRKRGARVRIVGRVRGTDGKVVWYVIKPPSDMRFYISARFVRSADGTLPPPPSEETPTTPVTPAVTLLSTPPTRAAVGAPVRQELDALRAIRALEKELVAETAKPVEERNFADILTRAEKIKLPKNSRFTPIYDSLMQYLREEVALVEQSRAVDRMVDDVLRRAAKKSAGVTEPTEAGKAPRIPEADRTYDLEGVLTLSTLYTLADPNQPKRYVVRHPQTKAVVGYVQTSGGKVNLEEYEGRNVGLRGRQTYDEAISMKILEVDSVTPLDEPAAPAKPQPAEPEPTEPEPTEPEPTEPEPAELEPTEPEPTEPEPAELEPTEPEPTEEYLAPEPSQPVETPEPAPADPEPTEVKPATPVAPEPPQPAEKPRPLESVEPAPTKPEPTEMEPLEPAEAKPATPVEEPKSLKPTEVKPPEPDDVEPPTLIEEPKTLEPDDVESPALIEEPTSPEPAEAEPLEPKAPESAEPESAEAEPIGPTPVEKKPTTLEPTDVTPAEPAPVRPTKPAKIEPAEIQPVEIKPLDVKPTEVESPVVKKLPAKTSEPKPMPAEQATEPDTKMFEVETTAGDIEVEWD